MGYLWALPERSVPECTRVCTDYRRAGAARLAGLPAYPSLPSLPAYPSLLPAYWLLHSL